MIARSRAGVVAPNGLAAALLLSILATAGIFYVNIMAAIVTGLIEGLHITAAQAGRIGASNVYGAALGAFAAVLVVRRIAWRPAATLLLCVLIGIDLTSTQLHAVPLLMGLRFLHGLAGGLLVGISYSVFARTASPDRCFGVLMVVQSSCGGLGVMFLPALVPQFGAVVLFLAMAAFSAAALVALPFLPPYPARPADGMPSANRAPGSFSGSLLIALLAVFCFQLGNMMLFAYIIELGRAHGLALAFMTNTVAISGWVATAGALLVVGWGTKWGRALPIAIGGVLAVLSNAAFHAAGSPAIYVAANVVSSVMWFFVLPYLLGLCASFDFTGRSAALAGLASKLGLASGPLLASLLLTQDQSYSAIINVAVGLLAVSTVCGVGVARNLKFAAGDAAALAK